MERYIPLLIIILAFSMVMIWSLLMQRKAVARQKQAMDTQREAIDMSKVQIEESLSLARKQVDNQEKIISILEQIRDKK